MVARRLVAVALAVVAVAAAASAFAAGSAPARPGPPPRVFAFLSAAGGTELQHLRAYGPRISVLAPNWYALAAGDLAVTGAPSPAVVDIARADGIALWPVVNARLQGVDVFAGAAARTRVVDEIASEAAARGYDGVTLDIEELPVSGSGDYTRFVSLLAARLHADHKRLAVYVPRRTADGGDAAYDWRALADTADLLIASGYNEHWSTGRPGPVTTAAGFGQMLSYAAGVSRTRVAPAIGAFGYAWPRSGGTGEMLSSIAALQLLHLTGATLRGGGGDAYFSAAGRIIHFQTAAALAARARDARDVGMRWLALFSLGREPDAFWSHLTTARQVVPGPQRG